MTAKAIVMFHFNNMDKRYDYLWLGNVLNIFNKNNNILIKNTKKYLMEF